MASVCWDAFRQIAWTVLVCTVIFLAAELWTHPRRSCLIRTSEIWAETVQVATLVAGFLMVLLLALRAGMESARAMRPGGPTSARD